MTQWHQIVKTLDILLLKERLCGNKDRTPAQCHAKYFIGLAYKENNLDSELAPLIGEMNYTRAYFLEADPEKRDSIFLVGSGKSVKNQFTPITIFKNTKSNAR